MAKSHYEIIISADVDDLGKSFAIASNAAKQFNADLNKSLKTNIKEVQKLKQELKGLPSSGTYVQRPGGPAPSAAGPSVTTPAVIATAGVVTAFGLLASSTKKLNDLNKERASLEAKILANEKKKKSLGVSDIKFREDGRAEFDYEDVPYPKDLDEVLEAQKEINKLNKENLTINKNINKSLREQAKAKAKVASLAKGAVVAGAAAATGAAGVAVSIADDFQEIENRLGVVLKSYDEIQAVQRAVYGQSQETGSAYRTNLETFAAMAVGMKEAGMGTKEILEITDLANKSLVVGGASAQESTSFLLQFKQALGSGRLGGDEFKAMMESNAYFGQQLAKALDTDIAGLYEMKEAGELTTDLLREAFPAMAQQIDADFQSMEKTVKKSFVTIGNFFVDTIDKANETTGSTGDIAKSIGEVLQVLEDHRPIVEQFFGFLLNSASLVAAVLPDLASGFLRAGEIVGGVFQSISSIVLALSGSVFKVLQGITKITDFLHITKGASDEWKISADAAFAAASDLGMKANDNFSAAFDFTEKAKNSTTELTEETKKLNAELSTPKKKALDEEQKKATAIVDDTYAKAVEKENAILQNKLSEANKVFNEKEKAEKIKAATETYNQLMQRHAAYHQDQLNAIQELITEGKKAADVMDSYDDETKAQFEMMHELHKNILEQMDKIQEKADDMKNQPFFPGEDSTAFIESWEKAFGSFSADATKQIDVIDQELIKLSKDRYVKIYVEKIQAAATGGIVGAYAAGGSVQPFKRMSGLITQGAGGVDDVPIMAMRKEFIQPVGAVEKYGLPFMESVRNGTYDPQSNKTFTFNFSDDKTGLSGSLKGSEFDIDKLERILKQRARLSK